MLRGRGWRRSWRSASRASAAARSSRCSLCARAPDRRLLPGSGPAPGCGRLEGVAGPSSDRGGPAYGCGRDGRRPLPGVAVLHSFGDGRLGCLSSAGRDAEGRERNGREERQAPRRLASSRSLRPGAPRARRVRPARVAGAWRSDHGPPVHRWVGRRRRVLPPSFVASLTLSGSAYCRALRGGHEVATGEPDLGHASGGSRWTTH
jgi:hypothetical protein